MTDTRGPWHKHHPSVEIGPWINDPGRSCLGLDTEAFFPEQGESPVLINKVKRICSHCPVMVECRDYALRATPRLAGIWGGLSERERALERRRLGMIA